jgi:putative transposase
VPPAMPLAKAVQSIKGCSSKGLNDTGAAGTNFAWQEGYGAFSVSASQTDGVVAYIENQPAHHARRNYEEEFVELLRRYGISYDPAYVFVRPALKRRTGWAVPPGLDFKFGRLPSAKALG